MSEKKISAKNAPVIPPRFRIAAPEPLADQLGSAGW